MFIHLVDNRDNRDGVSKGQLKTTKILVSMFFFFLGGGQLERKYDG